MLFFLTEPHIQKRGVLTFSCLAIVDLLFHNDQAGILPAGIEHHARQSDTKNINSDQGSVLETFHGELLVFF